MLIPELAACVVLELGFQIDYLGVSACALIPGRVIAPRSLRRCAVTDSRRVLGAKHL
jgi:hypothetical protein